jgi:hypothetical protein
MDYSERMAPAVRSALLAEERFVAAVPADAGEIDRNADRGHWHLRGTPTRRPTDLLVREQALPPEFLAAGRLTLVLTDQRLRVYRRRRWRSRPARHLADIPIRGLGNVEGVLQPRSGSTEFELMVILSDGTAVPLHVPNAYAADGTEFVRRAQALLRA